LKTLDGSACEGAGLLMPCATNFTGTRGDLRIQDVIILPRASSYLKLVGLTALKKKKPP